jgi:broad specificity phosphatase PhoE
MLHPLRLFLIAALALCGAPAGGVAQSDDAIFAALRSTPHVILIRHAQTAGGAGDPPGFRLEDCATQRPLTPAGRATAARIGEGLRAAGVPVAKVLSSQWCRCRDTASLMAVGPVEPAPTFDNAFTLHAQRADLTAGARAVIAAWTGPGNLVIVTHGANIQALLGLTPAEGETVVVRPDPAAAGGFRLTGRIPPPA